MNNKHLIVICGPTAVGKTNLSIAIAKHFNTEIISADARQFYKEMNIGTAKATTEELAQVKHHFVNNLSIHNNYSAGDFEKEANNLLSELFKEKDHVVMAGGSGLFIKAVVEGFDVLPEVPQSVRDNLNELLQQKGIKHLQELLKEKDAAYFNVVDINNPQRLIRALEIIEHTDKKYSSFLNQPKTQRPYVTSYVGLNMSREKLYERINKRVDIMMEMGLLEEVKTLKESQNLNALQTVGYAELFSYLNEKCSLEEAVALIKRNSRRYAKRQLTWFSKIENIKWFEPNQYNEIVEHIKQQIIH